MESINWLAVILAAAATFVLGFIWYGPLFGKPWQKMTGVKDEEAKKGMATTMGGSFILAVIIAISLSLFVGEEATARDAGVFGFFVGLTWVLPAFWINDLYEKRPLHLTLINGFYFVLLFAVAGMILGAF